MSDTFKLKHKISTRHIGGVSPDVMHRSLIRQAVLMTLKSESVDRPCAINVLITDNKGIRSYNDKYRGVDKATDVISFPMQNYSHPGWNGIVDIDIDLDTQNVPLGDIIISTEKIKKQAQAYRRTIEHETVHMLIHSTLHLLGYEHENPTQDREMKGKEKVLQRLMGYF